MIDKLYDKCLSCGRKLKTEQAIKTGEIEQDMAIDYIMLNILR